MRGHPNLTVNYLLSPVRHQLISSCRVMHPLVLDSVAALLKRATSCQIHLTQLIAIGPGEPSFGDLGVAATRVSREA